MIRIATLLAILVLTGCTLAQQGAFDLESYGKKSVAASLAPSGGDDTSAVNAAIVSANGGTVHFGPGTFLCNAVIGYGQRCHLQGDGAGSTFLISTTEDGAALTLADRHPVWKNATISGISFGRVSSADHRIGVRFGGDSYATGDEITGRYVFRDCAFSCYVGIYKQDGNIGNRFHDCTFACTGYGIYAYNRTSAYMHTGCDIIDGCHFQDSQNAAFYIEQAVAGGQTILRDNIFEQNPGAAIAVNGYVVWAGLFKPGFLLENAWLEANASLASPIIHHGGLASVPVAAPQAEISVSGSQAVRIASCTLHTVDLVGTIATAEKCLTTYATVTKDIWSSLVITP